MKKIITRCFLIFTISMAFSCKEDEIDLFTGKSALFIGVKMDERSTPENDMDSVRNVSFGFTDLQETTINFMVRLQGIPGKEDRKIKIKVAGSATKGSDYELNENVVLPAGAHYVLVPCKIIRNPTLMDTQKNIALSLVADELFEVPDTTRARINLSDGIPTNWVNNSFAAYVLGRCTKAKYQFFYDMMGYYDLADILYGDLNNISKYLNKKIEDYNLNPAKYEHKYGDVPLAFRFDPWD
ncbi:DUF4843 domain-containing protein [Pedobacter nyackensis]|uniref:DUF4843 domain-containing protein n=1 Tax=Pedobacter nyackensis TaxID=475255 RepID=A0A1W2CRJ0_9SPHI|nr:DUF4843 domain-containing protein [Pedobacter nyackensis]SMC87268.1 protein of unknown function [Pedobacter nyackensis]